MLPRPGQQKQSPPLKSVEKPVQDKLREEFEGKCGYREYVGVGIIFPLLGIDGLLLKEFLGVNQERMIGEDKPLELLPALADSGDKPVIIVAPDKIDDQIVTGSD